MNGAAGLSGWRWLFIIEGIPSCLSAFLVLFFLPDYPERAHWLCEYEKDMAIQRLYYEGSKAHHPTITWEDIRDTLTDWRLYAHYAMYFAMSPAFASLSLFAPSITAGLGYKDLQAQLMTVPPWVAAYGKLATCNEAMAGPQLTSLPVCQILVAWAADYFNARGFFASAAALIGALGFIVSATLPPDAYASRYGGLIMATVGTFACIPPMLGWLTSNIASTGATGLAIAINVSVGGGVGQIPGVWIYKFSERDEGFPTGHWTNAGLMLFVVVVGLGLRLFYGWRNSVLSNYATSQGVEARLFKL